MKTNPSAQLLACAKDNGFMAEVISIGELSWVQKNGFGSADVIYNGPLPLRREPGARPVAATFADSVEAFREYAACQAGRICGARLRPAGVRSRFGVPASRLGELSTAVRACDREFGISLHARPQDFDGRSWESIILSVAAVAAELERSSGRRVVVFDAGGGWTPDALDAALANRLAGLIMELRTILPHVETFVLEPGQSLATPCEAVMCSVAEVRCAGDGRREIVVDASFAQVPHIRSYAHRIAVASADGTISVLGPGRDRILGCTCLEHDILAADADLPPYISRGSLVFICDAGSYDSSMAFKFASGGARERYLHSTD